MANHLLDYFPRLLPLIVMDTVLITLLLCRVVFHQEAAMQTWRHPFSSESGEIMRLSISFI